MDVEGEGKSCLQPRPCHLCCSSVFLCSQHHFHQIESYRLDDFRPLVNADGSSVRGGELDV